MKISQFIGSWIVIIAGFSVFFGADAADVGRSGRSVVAATTVARMSGSPTSGLSFPDNSATKEMGNIGTGSGTGIPAATVIPTTPAYTVNECMNDLLYCINNGALQGGLNDLFNEDVRNSIFNGMSLCQNVIDKCLTLNDFNSRIDVWFAFNSRVVQPEYYNFVLRKTGLTPNQAENTCLLLDRNTYGSSFAAVGAGGSIKDEYNNAVNPYNSAKDASGKSNPMGVDVNQNDYDMYRGHYARWDATNAECLVRVAGYNKDKLIKNEWLGIGAGGNAEIWQRVGSTFTCDKNLFGFSLMNDTKSAAVLATTSGAVAGGLIGWGAAAGAYDKKYGSQNSGNGDNATELESWKKNTCDDDKYRERLLATIRAAHGRDLLSNLIYKDVKESDGSNGTVTVTGTKVFPDTFNWNNPSSFQPDQCNAIFMMYDKIKTYEYVVDACENDAMSVKISEALGNKLPEGTNVAKIQMEASTSKVFLNGDLICNLPDGVTVEDFERYKSKCLFKPLAAGFSIADNTNRPLCNHDGQCQTIGQIKFHMNRIKAFLNEISDVIPEEIAKEAPNRGAEIGKGVAIGAAVGVGAGGLATAITAFVEKNNINCRVGDGLNSVAYGKTHTIDSLKDFYTKWNLRLPDRIMPTTIVKDVPSLTTACAEFNSKLATCPDVQVSYKYTVDTESRTTVISSACEVKDGKCVPNESIIALYKIEDKTIASFNKINNDHIINKDLADKKINITVKKN